MYLRHVLVHVLVYFNILISNDVLLLQYQLNIFTKQFFLPIKLNIFDRQLAGLRLETDITHKLSYTTETRLDCFY